MNLREKLAKFMGWELDPGWGLYHHPDGREVLLPSNGVICPVGNKSWQPDIDRNQLALVLEKVGEKGLQRDVTNIFIDRHMEKLTSGSVYNGHGCLWDCLTAPPETICQAILKVIPEEPKQ